MLEAAWRKTKKRSWTRCFSRIHAVVLTFMHFLLHLIDVLTVLLARFKFGKRSYDAENFFTARKISLTMETLRSKNNPSSISMKLLTVFLCKVGPSLCKSERVKSSGPRLGVTERGFTVSRHIRCRQQCRRALLSKNTLQIPHNHSKKVKKKIAYFLQVEVEAFAQLETDTRITGFKDRTRTRIVVSRRSTSLQNCAPVVIGSCNT